MINRYIENPPGGVSLAADDANMITLQAYINFERRYGTGQTLISINTGQKKTRLSAG